MTAPSMLRHHTGSITPALRYDASPAPPSGVAGKFVAEFIFIPGPCRRERKSYALSAFQAGPARKRRALPVAAEPASRAHATYP